jgi:broad specificity phosphatase PhoE
LGEKQAYDAGAFLKWYIDEHQIPMELSALWESPYLRAEQTANGIKKHMSFFRNYQDPRLVERDMGLFDNVSRENWDELAPAETHNTDIRQHSLRGKFFCRLPQGESPLDVFVRISTFMESIYRDRFNNLFIVTHGAVIKVMLMKIFHHSLEWFYKEKRPANCSIRLIECDEDHKPIDCGYIYDGGGTY